MQTDYTDIFFIGIGGIGMSAVARYFNVHGYRVAGYDRTNTPLTEKLISEGINIIFDDNNALIGDNFKNREKCLVVYTPAIPENSNILNWYQQNDFNIKKRAQVLGLLTQTQQSICIGGTHGKTTISTMTGHLLYDSSVGCNAFIGGIAENYKSNLLSDTNSNKVVIEADEFDRSFLNLYPHTAVISAIDADHLDIYGTHEELLNTFRKFTAQIVEDGILIYKASLDFTPNVKNSVSKYTYEVNEGDFHLENVKLVDGLYEFDFVTPSEKICGFRLGIAGKVNVENAVAALTVAYLHGVPHNEMKIALANFKGIYRRFQYHINTPEIVYIDDYAHHPEELKATISSVKEIYGNRKVTGIFQPHLYSRTQDFAAEFAKALSLLDELWLMDIYPARELPIEGVTSNIIYNDVICPKIMLTCKQITEKLQNTKVDVLLTLGAGNIDTLIPEIRDILSE